MRKPLIAAGLVAAFTALLLATPSAADTPSLADQCRAELSLPGHTAAQLTWLRTCVGALTPPTPTPTGTPTPTPTAPAPSPSATPTPGPTTPPAPTPTPTPTPTPAPTGWPTPGDTAAGSTGWRHTGVTLTPVHGILYATTPGQVIDSVDAVDGIVVEANHVTISRSRVEGKGTGYGAGIWIVAGTVGTTISDVEVTSQPGADPTVEASLVDRAITAFQTTGTVMTRVYAHGMVRGLQYGCDTTITDSYVDGEVNPSGDHMSAIGGESCSQFTLTVRHNHIGLSPNPMDSAALLLYPPQVGAYGPQQLNITWADNLIRGGTYCLWLSSDPMFAGTVTVSGNRFDVGYYSSCGLYGPTFTDHWGSEGSAKLTWSDNAFVGGTVVGGP